MRDDFISGNVAVVLEELAACGAEISELFVVPRDVFRILINFGLTVWRSRGRRHCVSEVDLNNGEKSKSENINKQRMRERKGKKRETKRRICMARRSGHK